MTSKVTLTFRGHKLCQTERKSRRELWGHKVRNGDLLGYLDILGSYTRSNRRNKSLLHLGL